MNISASDLKELSALAIEAAVQSGDYIQTMVGKHQAARSKDVGDSLASRVVTEVDVESQRRILGVLGKSIVAYDLGFLTEESADDLSRLQKDYFWCVDPLDGTLPFIEGGPGYAVSIALVIEAVGSSGIARRFRARTLMGVRGIWYGSWTAA